MGWQKITLHTPLGIKCCAIEMAAAATPRFDGDRFGSIPFITKTIRCIVGEWPYFKEVCDKIVRLWEQMPEPKYCIAMGECAISGGSIFPIYNILEGVDTVIPVDVHSRMPSRPKGSNRWIWPTAREDYQNWWCAKFAGRC